MNTASPTTTRTATRARRRRRSVNRLPLPVYAALSGIVFFSVFPLYWMFVVATTDSASLMPGTARS